MMELKDFKLEEILKKRGQKIHGVINIAMKPDGSYIKLPVMIAIGKEDGRVILADGCNHGDEHEGSEAIINVYNSLDVSKMKGTFIGVPIVNLEAFSNMSRYSTIDFVPVDMNRIYPGKQVGFMTMSVANYYLDNFVKKADALITIHGGGNYLYLEPVTLYQSYGDDISKTSKMMAEAFGYKYLWENKNYSENSGILDEEAYKHGIPTITPEIGGQATRVEYREENINKTQAGILNVLKLFKVIDEDVKKIDLQINVVVDYIYCREGGIHKPKKRGGEMVKEGEIISIITNIFGEEIDTIIAPFDGIVIGYWAYSIIQPHSWGYMLGKFN